MKTEFVKYDDCDEAKIETAAKVLDQGGLVAFPTETVYGIGCSARTQGIERLSEVKGRSEGKRYTLHVADAEAACKYVPEMSNRGRKLISECWPGPLTVVFEVSEQILQRQRKVVDGEAFELLYKDGTIGIRCPDNAIAARLLGTAKSPIVAPSANISGSEPATEAKDVLRQFDGRVEMILDGGEEACKYKKSSTVVKIAGNELKILREGAYESKWIEESSMIQILFVCTGNTCRSPMAEAFCRKIISEKLNCGVDETEKIGYKVLSAGVMGITGMPASNEVLEICAEKGLDVRSHQSRALTTELIEVSDFIFVMSNSHYETIVGLCPEASEKCILLDEESDISDPIGGGVEVYRKCAKQIENALEKRMNEILK